MVCHHQRYPAIIMHFSPHGGKRIIRFQKNLSRNTTQAQDQFWADQFQLLPQIRFARGNLFRKRIPVVGGTAFQYVTNKDFFAFKTDRFQDLVQQLTRPADERLPLCIFVRPGSFADEHEISVRVSHSEHKFCSRGSQRAFLTCTNCFVQLIEILQPGPRFTGVSPGHGSMRPGFKQVVSTRGRLLDGFHRGLACFVGCRRSMGNIEKKFSMQFLLLREKRTNV